jgi:gamma-glutamyltranspeptidase/glutathione hydrolase
MKRMMVAGTMVAATLLPLVAGAQAGAKHGMVVSVQHDASDAGLAILQAGGNAVDAAVATGFALAVTWPRAGNIGGGGFMLVRNAKTGEVHFLDFRERAPMKATADMYLDAQGNVIPRLSTLGYKAIGVPGTVAGLVYAQQHYGKLTLKQDMAPAIKLATEGFVLTGPEAQSLQSRNMAQFPESKRVFMRDGNFYAAGDTLKQPDLAKTLVTISEKPDDFYKGAIAKQLAAGIEAHGGLVSEADLAAYTVAVRKPLLTTFTVSGKDGAETYDLITSPPPSSGGIVLLETLNMLKKTVLTEEGAGLDRTPAQIHLITEAFRRAYMDRSDYLGDPDYTSLPIAQMASEKYAAAWAAGIDPEKPTPSASLVRPAGFLPPPPALPQHKESTQTTQFSVVDSEGNAVSTTYTLNGVYGCGATAEGLGFVLNNEMDDFSSKPGTPNMFGLIQGPANAIGPGHRPLSSMTPTLVTTHAVGKKPGELRLVLGSPGGATIITTVANDLLSILVNGLTVQAAADAPRFHHQYLPDVLEFEKAFPKATVDAMAAMGYKVNQANPMDAKTPGVWGASEMIEVNPKSRTLEGANDMRYPSGKVASY